MQVTNASMHYIPIMNISRISVVVRHCKDVWVSLLQCPFSNVYSPAGVILIRWAQLNLAHLYNINIHNSKMQVYVCRCIHSLQWYLNNEHNNLLYTESKQTGSSHLLHLHYNIAISE